MTVSAVLIGPRRVAMSLSSQVGAGDNSGQGAQPHLHLRPRFGGVRRRQIPRRTWDAR